MRFRAQFCANAVVLAVNIRNHFERNRLSCAESGRMVPGPQYKIPFRSAVARRDADDFPPPFESPAGQGSQEPPARIVCYQHLTDDDLNGVEYMMGDEVGEDISDEFSMPEAAWKDPDQCFNDGYTECIETTLLDEMPVGFEGMATCWQIK